MDSPIITKHEVELAYTSPPPIGLTLDIPSTLEYVRNAIREAREANSDNTNISFSNQQEKFKLKASNFPASLLQIGSWRIIAMNGGDLVVKVYFAKRKFVWEILDHCLKKKIEIHWNNVVGLKVIMEQRKPAILQIEVSQPPIFFQETHPQPKKLTSWHHTQDFTNQQASLIRIHYLEIPCGAMDKHFDNILKCEPRFIQLIQGPFPSLISPYFASNFNQRIDSSTPSEFKVSPSMHFGIQRNNNGNGYEINSNLINPINMCYGNQANEQVNGCKVLPEYKPSTSMNYGIQGIVQENCCNIAPKLGCSTSTYFCMSDNGQLNDSEMATEFGPSVNMYDIKGNWKNTAVGFEYPFNMHYGMKDSQQENICNMTLELNAHTNINFWHENGAGMEMDTSFVAPTNIPFNINGNKHGVDSFGVDAFQPELYSSIPSIAPVSHNQIHELINTQSYWKDSSRIADEIISNKIVDDTYMAYWNQDMRDFQNHQQNYNQMGQVVFPTDITTQEYHHHNCDLPITSDEGFQSQDMLIVTDIQQLLDNSKAQCNGTQNLQTTVNSMHTSIDLHNKMNFVVAPVEDTTYYENQMILNENWVPNTMYSNRACEEFQPQPQPLQPQHQPLICVAPHQDFNGNSETQQTTTL